MCVCVFDRRGPGSEVGGGRSSSQRRHDGGDSGGFVEESLRDLRLSRPLDSGQQRNQGIFCTVWASEEMSASI